MNYWKVILATVVIFGTGVMTGGLLVNHVEHSRSKNPHRPPAGAEQHTVENHAPPRAPEIPMPRLAEKMGKQFVQQLNEKLQLTPEQREKIGQIIAGGQERNRAIWTNVAPEMRAVIQDVNRQIRAELKPAQLKLFEQILKRPPRRPSAVTNAPSANALGF